MDSCFKLGPWPTIDQSIDHPLVLFVYRMSVDRISVPMLELLLHVNPYLVADRSVEVFPIICQASLSYYFY